MKLPLLTILTFVPLVGAVMVIGLGAEQKKLARWLALGFSLAALALTLVLWTQFQAASGSLQFEESAPGFRRWGSSITSASMGWAC